MTNQRMALEPARSYLASRMNRRGFLRLGGGGLAGAALWASAGCGVFEGGDGGGSASTGGGGGGSKTLNRNIGAEIADLDSATTTDEVSFEVLANVMEGLYRLDGNEEPQPAMAQGVEMSDDELTYTFTLRDGITWSNGDPITSQDFKFAWLRAIDPEVASQYAFIIADFVDGAAQFNSGDGSRDDVAIQTPDDKTLRVSLAGPTPFFLGLTAFATYFPQNQAFVEEQGDNYAQGADTLLYNGPFVMSEYDPASGGSLDKNGDYWDASNVDIERISMRIVKDRNTALDLYQSGELDLTGLSGEQVARFTDDPEFFRSVNFTNFYGQMNQQNAAMANVNIRKALMIGFDRKALAEQVLQDGSEPAYSLVPPGMAGPGDQTFRKANGDLIPADTSQAKQFWDTGVQELGEEPSISMLFTDTTTARDIATFIQQQYRENLGIEAKIENTTFENALDRTDNLDYQISYASGWGADYNDPMTFMDLFLSNSPFNRASWSNDRYDELVNGAKKETDEQARMEMLLQAEQILFDEAVLVPEYNEAVVGLKKPYLKNYTTHPYGASPDWKYARLEGKE